MKTSSGKPLLLLWLQEAVSDSTKRAKHARDAYGLLQNKSTTYATDILAIAEIHEEAAALYRRRLDEYMAAR